MIQSEKYFWKRWDSLLCYSVFWAAMVLVILGNNTEFYYYDLELNKLAYFNWDFQLI